MPTGPIDNISELPFECVFGRKYGIREKYPQITSSELFANVIRYSQFGELARFIEKLQYYGYSSEDILCLVSFGFGITRGNLENTDESLTAITQILADIGFGEDELVELSERVLGSYRATITKKNVTCGM